MRVRMIVAWFLVACFVPLTGRAQGPVFSEYRGNYLNQPPPGTKAVPFAPGFFPDDAYSAVVFSSDGREAYWSSQAHMYQSRQIDGRWTKPESLIIDSLNGTCPTLSPDGKRLYFVTWNDQGIGIAYVERTSTGWSKPLFLPGIINEVAKIHWTLSLDRAGNLYFSHGGSITDIEILHSEFRNGIYTKPAVIENLKDDHTFCPFVAPDGSYLIFAKGTQPGGPGKAFFIMFKDKAGRWGRAINISDIIGASGFSPTVSPDGRFLFFCDARRMYWVDASFIAELRKREPS